MTKKFRKISAVILLALLAAVPFFNWRLGAVLWMCAWLVYIFQNLFPRHDWKVGEEEERDTSE